MSSKGNEVVPSSSGGGWPRCAACQHLERACGLWCVFAPHFPAGDNPARFAAVHAAFGADNAAGFLRNLPPDQRAEGARLLVVDASQLRARGGRPPCAACQHLQRTCVVGCVFAPQFQAVDSPVTFATLAAAFSADDVAEVLHNQPPEKQADAVRSLVLLAEQASTSAGPGPVPPPRPQLGVRRPCAACKQFHRRCEPNCVFAPCFPGPGLPEAEEDAGTMKIEHMLSPPQVAKMDKVMGSAVGKAMALPQDGAELVRQIAGQHAGDDHLVALTKPFLVPDPSTSAPGVSTDTAVETTRTMPTEEDDETWNKRQTGYVFVLSTTVALVYMMRPFLPAAYAPLILFVIAAVWGLGSVGLPCGLYGTSRWEKEFSRHVGRLIHALFSVLGIYGFYVLALHFDDSTVSAPSASPSEVQAPTDGNYEFWWTVGFVAVGASVLAGIFYSWIRGCRTGGDRDRYP